MPSELSRESKEEPLAFEFEGPFGRFWMVKDVPTESIVLAVAECLHELYRRGHSSDDVAAKVRALHKERAEWPS